MIPIQLMIATHPFFQLVRVETIPLGTYIMSARLLIKAEEPHPRQSYALSPLPASGEGIKRWGAMTVVSITN